MLCSAIFDHCDDPWRFSAEITVFVSFGTYIWGRAKGGSDKSISLRQETLWFQSCSYLIRSCFSLWLFLTNILSWDSFSTCIIKIYHQNVYSSKSDWTKSSLALHVHHRVCRAQKTAVPNGTRRYGRILNLTYNNNLRKRTAHLSNCCPIYTLFCLEDTKSIYKYNLLCACSYFCSIFPPLPQAQREQAAVPCSGSFPVNNTAHFSIKERGGGFSLLLSAATLRVSGCLVQSKSRWE